MGVQNRVVFQAIIAKEVPQTSLSEWHSVFAWWHDWHHSWTAWQQLSN